MNFSDLTYLAGSFYGQLASKFHINLNSRSAVSAIHFNQCLKSLLDSNQPCLLGRLGDIESRLIRAFATGCGQSSPLLTHHAARNAGIGPKFELKAVVDLYLNNILDFMFLAEWPCSGHSFIMRHLANHNKTPYFYNLEFLNPLSLVFTYGLDPSDLWLHSLYGKRILVVHPFEVSFRSSTTRRLGSFEKELLPVMNYTCYVPPVTFGKYPKPFSFLSLLDKAFDQLSKTANGAPFDIALVAAGGYGLPIASFLYRESIAKKVLHVGGALQLYFGVIGNRWLSPPYIQMYSKYENLHKWSKVLDQQPLIQAKSVELGCYV
jgi:hypothetical protein